MALVLVGQQARRQSMVDEDEKLIEERDEIEEREVLRRASNVERVESAFDVYKARAAELMKEHNPDLISQAAFKDICRIQRERFLGCLSLPGTLFVFFLFALSTYLHADVLTAYLVESVVGDNIGANSPEIENINDAWEWIEGVPGEKEGLVDLFWGDEQTNENGTQKELWKPILTYNYLVGPIVLKQLRSERALCTQTDFQNMLCYKQNSRSTESFGTGNGVVPVPDPNEHDQGGQSVTQQRRREYWERAFGTLEVWKAMEGWKDQWPNGRRLEDEDDTGILQHFSEDSVAGTIGRKLRAYSGDMTALPAFAKADSDTFLALLSPNNYKATVLDQLRFLRAGDWLDQQTLSLKIQVVLLNAEVGRPRLTQVTVIMYFSRAGGVFTDVEVNTVFLKFWPGYADMSFGADFIFLCCLIVMTVMQARQVPWKRYFLRVRNWRKIVSRVTAPAGALLQQKTGPPLFWSLLQLAILGCGWACVGCHGIAYLYTRGLKTKFEASWKAQKADFPPETTVGTSLDLHDTVEQFVLWNGTTRFLFALYHILLIVRFFIAFHAQPRLGVVTRTLEVSLIDILHFLVVLLPTFCSYAISGCFIFGKRVQDFSNLIASVGTCFKIFMESEYDWIILSEEDFWTPFVWVLTFMILLVMIMLNMVLAIILDVYTEIRKKSGQSETVWVTMWHGLQQMYHWRNWIATSELMAKVSSLPPNISRADLTRAFPQMCDEQVEQLYAAAKNHHTTTEQGNEQDARKLALSVKLVMDNINRTLGQLDEGTSEKSTLLTGGKGWLPDLANEMAVQNHMMLSLQWHLQQIEWQWEALDTIHGEDATFSGQHKLTNKKQLDPL